MATGTVKFFNTDKGFGYIMPDGTGADVFVHAETVKAAGLESLSEGQKVEYDHDPGARASKPIAKNLKVL